MVESLKTMCLSECGCFQIIAVRLITAQVKLGSPQQPNEKINHSRPCVFATHSLLTSRHGETESTTCCFMQAQHMNDMTDMTSKTRVQVSKLNKKFGC